MATVTETQTTNPLAQSREADGALVHNLNQSQDMVHAQQRHSMMSQQPRPLSGVYGNAPVEQEEERPGQKTTQKFLPWYTRWGYNISLGVATGVLKPASFIRDTQDAISSPLHHPNMTRTYDCRKLLPTRVFFPKPFDKTKPPRKLPVLFTIHGGHFIMGTPQDNDAWNAKFATKFGFAVVGLNYAKAPKNAFPGPIHDVEALILATLTDTELAPHIDRSRISVLGWSSGGNLALAVSQLPAIRRIATSVVALYPPTDFTVSHHQKSRLRRYKPGVGGFRSRETDYMLSMAPMIDWSYIPQGTELRNPLLSPYFADHDMLPRRVFIVGCELDMFAHEAWRTISKLAGRDIAGWDTPVGREGHSEMGQMHLDDERYHWEQSYNDGSSYKWLLVPDTIHNFDQRIGGVIRDTDFRADAEQKSETTMKEIGEWLGGPTQFSGNEDFNNGVHGENETSATAQAPPQLEHSGV
ncbi:unnamed protein product [Discula destructiva]